MPHICLCVCVCVCVFVCVCVYNLLVQSFGNKEEIHRIPDVQPSFLTFSIGNLIQKLFRFASVSALPEMERKTVDREENHKSILQ